MDESKLKQYRQEISAIDQTIIKLIADRLDIASKIAKIKKDLKIPIKDFRVEKEVYEANKEHAQKHGVYSSLAEELTKILIRFSITKQEELYKPDLDQLQHHQQKKILIFGGYGHMGQWLQKYFGSFQYQVQPHDAYKFSELETITRGSDLIILSTPLDKTAQIIEDLSKIKTQALVVDICSLKSQILKTILAATKSGMRICSIHPMFGPQAEFLSGKKILICHHSATAKAEKEVQEYFKYTAAEIIPIDLEKHDEVVGYLLGLSHLLNHIFANALSRSEFLFAELSKISSTTFEKQVQVTLPVVHENENLYFDIQRLNDFKDTVISRLETSLADFKQSILKNDKNAFIKLVEQSRKYLDI